MAVDLTSIFRKINQRKATGGYVPQGFAEDVMKANLGAEIAKQNEAERLATQKEQFAASQAQSVSEAAKSRALTEKLAADAAAARANEFATTTDLTKEAQAGQKTQGLTSSLVQLPMAAATAKYLWPSTPNTGAPPSVSPQGTAANPAPVQRLPGPENPYTPPPDNFAPNRIEPVNANPPIPGDAGGPSVPENPIVPEAYNPNTPYNPDLNVTDTLPQTDVMPAESLGNAAQGASEVSSTGYTQPLPDYGPADYTPAADAAGTQVGSTGPSALGAAGVLASVYGQSQMNKKYNYDANGNMLEPGQAGAKDYFLGHPISGAGGATAQTLLGDSNIGTKIFQAPGRIEEKTTAPIGTAFNAVGDLFAGDLSAAGGNIEKSVRDFGSAVTDLPGDSWQAIKGPAGKVICTELHRQGLLSDFLFENEAPYRGMVADEVYAGYRILADPIVPLMTRYKLFVRFMALFAVPAAQEMAHRVNNDIEGSLFGRLILGVFLPICYQLGRRCGNVVNPVIP